MPALAELPTKTRDDSDACEKDRVKTLQECDVADDSVTVREELGKTFAGDILKGNKVNLKCWRRINGMTCPYAVKLYNLTGERGIRADEEGDCLRKAQ